MEPQSKNDGRVILAATLMVSLAMAFSAVQLRKGLEGIGACPGGRAVLYNMAEGVEYAGRAAVPVAQPSASIAPENTVFAATFLAEELFSDHHVYGAQDAPISLVAFMDFECGFCASFYPTAQQVVDDSKGLVNLVFKHFPLSADGQSYVLHNAAECYASIRGPEGFYEFVADAYSSPVRLNPASIGNYLRDAGKGTDAEVATFTACLEERAFGQRIARSRALGERVGVAGTPALMAYNHANGKAFFQIGNAPPERLREMLQQIQ